MMTPESQPQQEELQALPLVDNAVKNVQRTTEEIDTMFDGFWDRVTEPGPHEDVPKLYSEDSIDFEAMERNQQPLMHMPPMVIYGVSEADFANDDVFNKFWDEVSAMPPPSERND